MPVTLICPRLTCRAILRVPDEVRGKRVRCAECGTTLLVPKTRKTRGSPPAGSKPTEDEDQTA